MSPIESGKLRNKKFNQTRYKQSIDSLVYFTICTRLDILFSFSKVSINANNPTYEDWESIKKIFRYLKGNRNYEIKLTIDDFLIIYVDGDYAGDIKTKKSNSRYLIKIGTSAISWYSKLQNGIALSITKNEYYEIVKCEKECLWYINIFSELKIKYKILKINVDNQAVIYNCENEAINLQSKNLDIKYYIYISSISIY